MPLNSNDISKLDFDVLWDLSVVPAKAKITNMSEGSNLAGCKFWFELTSGGGLLFHQGVQATPDRTGVWTDFDVPEDIPVILGHVEWSGSYFKCKGFVEDSDGNVFDFEKTDRICRPNGNTGNQANNFGKAELYIETRCEKAREYVEDRTNYSYNGNAGTMISKSIKFIYPEDSTGTTAPPKEVLNANSAQFPISFSAEGYRVILTAVYQYLQSNGNSIKIKYKANILFAIQCNIDLCPLICDIKRMEQQFEKNGCSAEEREKLTLINSKMNRAIMAKMQPLCGESVADIVEEIKKLGGFTCNCVGNEANGINEVSIGGTDCDGTLDCLNTLLNQITPNCLSDEWTNKTILEKFTLMVAGCCCTAIGGACAPPINPVVVSAVGGAGTGSVGWTASPDTVEAYEWIVYKVSDNSIIDSGSGAGTVANFTGLVAATSYRFEVRSKCGSGQYSGFVQLPFATA